MTRCAGLLERLQLEMDALKLKTNFTIDEYYMWKAAAKLGSAKKFV